MPLDNCSCFIPCSCGSNNSIALDVNNKVWSFNSWGNPYRIVSALVNGSSPETTPIQVESGGRESYVLMESGDVLLWTPYDDQSQTQMRQTMQQLGLVDAKVFTTSDDTIQCITWDFEQPIYRLPPIPSNLPDLNGDKNEEEVKLVKIAGFWYHRMVGLTNRGHLLIFDGHPDEIRAEGGNQDQGMQMGGQWTYVCCSHLPNCQ